MVEMLDFWFTVSPFVILAHALGFSYCFFFQNLASADDGVLVPLHVCTVLAIQATYHFNKFWHISYYLLL